MQDNQSVLLVVAAHPDDEVLLGCGATVRRLVDRGAAAISLAKRP